jgi:DNA gyrase subunit B
MAVETKPKKGQAAAYDSSSIKTLLFPESVRLRPTMYIGEVGLNGCFHLFREIFDNCLDEHMNGHGSRIDVTIDQDGLGCTVEDDGRGIPVDKGALEKILCTLHSGGKFEEGAYATSAGLNGVGSSCVNALSDLMEVQVRKDGHVWFQDFARGKRKTEIKQGKATKRSGTRVHFRPDASVMEEVGIEGDRVAAYCEQQTYLNAGLTVTLTRHVDGEKTTSEWHHPGGIAEYVADLNSSPISKKVFHASLEEKGMSAEVALGWSSGDEDGTVTFCNSINTTEGGTHLQGFRLSLSVMVKAMVEQYKSLQQKKDSDVTIDGEDTREGIVAVISVKHSNPKYHGQTKQKLSNTDIQGLVQRLINTELKIFFESNPDLAKQVAAKAAAAARGRVAGKAAKLRVQREAGPSFLSINNVGKLAGCSSKKPEECELLIVEGDSAGGSAKTGRDIRVQAIYSLRGKPMNSCEELERKVLDNKELSDLTAVIGAGIGAAFDPEAMRYHKVIMLADADVDGHHIACLLTAFFWRHMRPLVEGGYLYKALSPLYRTGAKAGAYRYFKDEDEYQAHVRAKAAKANSVWVAGASGEWEAVDEKAVRAMLRKAGPHMAAVKAAAHELSCSERLADFLASQGGGEGPAQFLEACRAAGLEARARGTIRVMAKGAYEDRYHSLSAGPEQHSLRAVESTRAAAGGHSHLCFGPEGAEPDVLPFAEAVARMLASATPKHRQRIKGLGESGADELWATTLDPAARTLLRVTVADAEAADELVVKLMGRNPDTRKAFLEENQGGDVDLDV